MNRQLLSVLAFHVCALATPALADCRFPPITFCDGCTLDRPIEVKKNAACEFVGYIHNGSFRGFETVQKPRLGQFGISSPTYAAYRAGPKAGQDRFVYRVKWEVFGKPHTATIVNRVTILD